MTFPYGTSKNELYVALRIAWIAIRPQHVCRIQMHLPKPLQRLEVSFSNYIPDYGLDVISPLATHWGVLFSKGNINFYNVLSGRTTSVERNWKYLCENEAQQVAYTSLYIYISIYIYPYI